MKLASRYRRYIPWLIAALILAGSFSLSSMDGGASNETSGFFTKKITELLQPLIDFIKESPEWLLRNETNHALRKLAHLIIYFSLMLFFILGIRGFTRNRLVIYAGAYLMLFAVALIDEFHQSLISGRTAAMSDVLLDAVGATIVLPCILIWRLLWIGLAWLRRDWPTKVNNEKSDESEKV